MRIPVFVSAPTHLSSAQVQILEMISEELERYGLEERRLGNSDYPTELSLREVLVLARHCAGGIILGFEQLLVEKGVAKRGTKLQKRLSASRPLPTEWNHLEAGLLFALQIPLLVFREEGITGGVFDAGVTDAFVHQMPAASASDREREALTAVFLKWQASVRAHYYR